MRWFNDKVLEKMISFSRVLKETNFTFRSNDFFNLKDKITKNAFVYMDPPYTLTRGSYNDGRRGFLGWSDELERTLLEFADKLNAQGNKFMLSYVVKHGGKINGQVKPWIERMGYRIIEVPPIPSIKRNEVLIVNYE